MVQSSRFCWTLNNYTADEVAQIVDRHHGGSIKYGVFGREISPTTQTPHLQGFFIAERSIVLSTAKALISPRCHIEPARGNSKQAAEYCKKDGDFEEYGDFPGRQGKRTDIDDFVDWVKSCPTKPSERDVAANFPGIFLRYPRLSSLVTHLRPAVELIPAEAELRGWQQELWDELDNDPDDRSIVFVIDPQGGSGKSWFVRYMLSRKPDQSQFLSIGKRDDMAYAIDETKKIFLFDIPRLGMQFLQYSVLEKLKDRMIFSGKYMSNTKFIEHPVHVVVFCNEAPDMNALTIDRYKFIDI